MRDQFVTVQITLLSVIVALILENLLGVLHGPESVEGTAWWIRWLSVSALAGALLSTWGGFTVLAILSTRPPSLLDFIAPCGLLVLLVQAVIGIGNNHPRQILLFLAAASALAAWSLWVETRYFNTQREEGPRVPALVQSGIAVVSLLAAGAYYTLQEQWIAVAALGLMTITQCRNVYGIVLTWQDLFTDTANKTSAPEEELKK